MSVRSYTDRDWPAVCRLHDRARLLELQGCVPSTAIPALDLALASEDGFFTAQKLVAELGDPPTVIGFVCLAPPEITWLYVDPAVRRRGVARGLLDRVLPVLGPEAFVVCSSVNARAGAVFPGLAHGYPCECLRLCLPTSSHRERPPRPMLSALKLAGFSEEDPGRPVRDSAGVLHWVHT